VDRLIAIYNIDVCFLLETKIKIYTDSFIYVVGTIAMLIELVTRLKEVEGV